MAYQSKKLINIVKLPLYSFSYVPKEADIQVLIEKDQTIQELRETIEVFY